MESSNPNERFFDALLDGYEHGVIYTIVGENRDGLLRAIKKRLFYKPFSERDIISLDSYTRTPDKQAEFCCSLISDEKKLITCTTAADDSNEFIERVLRLSKAFGHVFIFVTPDTTDIQKKYTDCLVITDSDVATHDKYDFPHTYMYYDGSDMPYPKYIYTAD
jgi:hypothetical protein